jgi:hypothetical protein
MQENIQNNNSVMLEDLEKKREEQIEWIKKLLDLGYVFSVRNKEEGMGYTTILNNNEAKQKIIAHSSPILDEDLQ